MNEMNAVAKGLRDLETTSATSSVLEGIYENGLRYHSYKAGKYPFPNDEAEQERDDLKHEMTIKLCSGKHFYAPIDKMLQKGGEALDLGKWAETGTTCTIKKQSLHGIQTALRKFQFPTLGR